MYSSGCKLALSSLIVENLFLREDSKIYFIIYPSPTLSLSLSPPIIAVVREILIYSKKKKTEKKQKKSVIIIIIETERDPPIG